MILITKIIHIGLYRKDLLTSKKNIPIDKIVLNDFMQKSISQKEIEEAERITFFDDDNTKRDLKNIYKGINNNKL